MNYANETVPVNLVNQRLDKEFTMTKKIQSYSTEFKAEAVKEIADNSGSR